MTTNDELVTAIIHVHQRWVETSGMSMIFTRANVESGQPDILAIPVTRWDISDNYFVAFTFYPRVLEHEAARSIKIFAPKQEIALIVELKSPEGMATLGYKKTGS